MRKSRRVSALIAVVFTFMLSVQTAFAGMAGPDALYIMTAVADMNMSNGKMNTMASMSCASSGFTCEITNEIRWLDEANRRRVLLYEESASMVNAGGIDGYAISRTYNITKRGLYTYNAVFKLRGTGGVLVDRVVLTIDRTY